MMEIRKSVFLSLSLSLSLHLYSSRSNAQLCVIDDIFWLALMI